ncbi:phosphoribosylaminoimidazolesuccinocarboxamide synthase [Blattabacterium cuenoti]|uniref:phosphoribosylaminoimidazolesuccinocarboxamide synthase n=1 Tax=Blattabacterium cuenoti TaxID=1653831 RepID=UPI00163C070F|nr:phosphoribosylaminoimidazolesuccinocarboxamide synthase [Blattabacterium cuenoti]
MSSSLTKKFFLLEGKTKKIFSTENPNKIILHYKDELSALNGLKKEFLQKKGILNNEISSFLFKKMNYYGINTHFIRKINNREQLCHKVNMIPLEFVIRNIITGSMSKRLGIKKGTIPSNTIFEIFYKNDALMDPFINIHHAVFICDVSYEELNIIHQITLNINNFLKKLFLDKNIILVDFKIEFGKNKKNKILLSDEISPDTCRLWDKKTNKKLDKDVFRNNSHKNILDIYMEVLKRLNVPNNN